MQRRKGDPPSDFFGSIFFKLLSLDRQQIHCIILNETFLSQRQFKHCGWRISNAGKCCPQCGSVPIAGSKVGKSYLAPFNLKEAFLSNKPEKKSQSLRSHVWGFHQQQELQCLHKLFGPFHLSSFSFSYLDSQHSGEYSAISTLVVYQLNEP